MTVAVLRIEISGDFVGNIMKAAGFGAHDDGPLSEQNKNILGKKAGLGNSKTSLSVG